ncbi:Ubiquinone/menaquinone biosynthesis C-methylase UbiE [Chitinophaga eiseniae]|uniref:Ubiquinone/menaquinone biosynthesis C-methylase UbiE n=1 Tax=Chitinophaga eiseniae TaxID=634771 RepID=A0A1T4M4E1_9BACT|nr:class I SAM-dependent methyltransferase [Chitinophaga eiseniae]SJZ61765.1 Ubiquinone/menaquinone biosynthesis C-methylase UbiE [Chitinophaga eiseniae]
MQNNTSRFSNRVEDYVKYRPHYPAAMIAFLEQQSVLQPGMLLADIGSGTGISAELFLQKGCAVLGVEPNREMREKSEVLLKDYPKFFAVDGTAEHTTLEKHCIDVIIAGQAFHWFNQEAARAEFTRILKPEGYVILVWNERMTGSPFEKAYEQLIAQYGNQYKELNHRNIDIAVIEQFFHPAGVTLTEFANKQVFDYSGLEGRLLSSSYMPTRDDARYPAMAADLKQLFDQFQEDGHITIHYATRMYWGRIM